MKKSFSGFSHKVVSSFNQCNLIKLEPRAKVEGAVRYCTFMEDDKD